MSTLSTYYLEMNSAAEVLPAAKPDLLDVVEAEIKDFRLNRFLYQLVGEPWQWTDKLNLPEQVWRDYAEREVLRTWVAYSQGAIAGYFELEQQEAGNVQLMYFGLSERFIGRGFGAYLLSYALDCAWAWQGTKRVWVHTCSTDHPSALANYQARGLRLYKTEQSEQPR